MNLHNAPLVPIPPELTDEAAVQVLDFLYELTRVFENYYAAQLHRLHHQVDEHQTDLFEDRDPPF